MTIGKAVRVHQEPRPWALMFAAVCLVAANMRTTIMGVGPLLEQIAVDQDASPAALGALASVPLVAWALISPLAHGLSSRLGLTRAVTWSLLVLLIGTVWRSLPGAPANLWLGTALIGASLAIGNVLLPAVIKREFARRIPLVMGVYSALLSGVSSVAAGLAVPISRLGAEDHELGWRLALLCSGALLPLAIIVWIVANTRSSRRAASTAGPGGKPGAEPDTGSNAIPSTRRSPETDAGRRIWADGVAWLVALYMGAQSAVFFTLAAWIAPIGSSFGRSAVSAGFDVMLYQMLGVGGTMLVPLMFRSRLRRWWPAILPLFTSTASIGIVTTPDLMPLWIVLGGPASGAALSLSLTLMAVRARDANAASALSGMAQSVGYLLAAIGPVLFGWLHEISGDWIVPLGLILVMAALQLAAGIAVGRDRFVLDRPDSRASAPRAPGPERIST